jgi:hypothetical protein
MGSEKEEGREAVQPIGRTGKGGIPPLGFPHDRKRELGIWISDATVRNRGFWIPHVGPQPPAKRPQSCCPSAS